ncbi:MAG TPA: hypothetical protein VF121_01830 [Thermoanaerobaculia bacterium]|nr:hypothetical protein [Thermoanaerobaculia bacterium]
MRLHRLIWAAFSFAFVNCTEERTAISDELPEKVAQAEQAKDDDYKLKIRLSGAVGLVPTTNQGGKSIIWAFMPKGDEQYRLKIPGKKPVGYLPFHYAVVRVRAKNLIHSTLASTNDGSLFVRLGTQLAQGTAPEPKSVGHELSFKPVSGDFSEPIGSKLDETKARFPRLADITSGVGAGVAISELLGDPEGLDEWLAARFLVERGTLSASEVVRRKWDYRYYKDNNAPLDILQGDEFEDLPQHADLELTYPAVDLVLELRSFSGVAPARQTFTLRPAQGEKNVEVEILNLPATDLLGLLPDYVPEPTRLEHFALLYRLTKTTGRKPFPVMLTSGGKEGAHPFCTLGVIKEK